MGCVSREREKEKEEDGESVHPLAQSILTREA